MVFERLDRWIVSLQILIGFLFILKSNHLPHAFVYYNFFSI